MYFSHERSSPIQISDRERDWRGTNEETDMFEMEQLAPLAENFSENVQKERLKEKCTFKTYATVLVSTTVKMVYIMIIAITSMILALMGMMLKIFMMAILMPSQAPTSLVKLPVRVTDIYHEEKQQKERDDMEKHLRIVREKIRLRRLEHESNTLKMMHEHNDKSSNEYVNFVRP